MVKELSAQGLEEIFGRRELETMEKRMAGKPLTQTERNYLSRSIRPKLMAARMATQGGLYQLLERPGSSSEQRVIFNLARYGIDLVIPGPAKKEKRLKAEELISEILTKCPKARYIEAIPLLLVKKRIDTYRLAEIAFIQGLANKIGYLAETADIILKKSGKEMYLQGLTAYLWARRKRRHELLGEEKDMGYTSFLHKTTPLRLRRWRLLGRFFDKDFMTLAEVYA
ncbi:MAG: hypothetical protein KJ709_04325 [Nanoarchaeota archaeon]|nr:hypothetical protein [Nanoarchaeota archaeon]